MSNSSIWPIDRTLSGATTLDQSGPGSDGNEGVLCIPQSSSIAEASSSYCLMSYTGHSLVGSYPFAEIQWVYSAASADWAVYTSNISVWHPTTPGTIKCHICRLCGCDRIFCNKFLIDCLIDLNSTLTYLGLYIATRLGNQVHYNLVFPFIS